MIFPKSHIPTSGAAYFFTSVVSQLWKSKGTVFFRGYNHKKNQNNHSQQLSTVKESQHLISY